MAYTQIDNFEKAFEIEKKIQPNNPNSFIISLSNLALISYELQKYSEALEYVEEATLLFD